MKLLYDENQLFLSRRTYTDNENSKKYTKSKGQDKQLTDKELIRKVHNGNKEALNTLISSYYDDIYRFCLYLTGQEADSYDITQEVFLRFIKYMDSYQHRNLKGYLLIIARNLCRDHFHRRKEPVSIEEAVWLGREDKRLSNLEDSLLLHKALQQLPMKQREIIVMRIYEELPFHEIARITGCTCQQPNHGSDWASKFTEPTGGCR